MCNATHRVCTGDRDCDQEPGCSEWQCFMGTDHRGTCRKEGNMSQCAHRCMEDRDCRADPGCSDWQCTLPGAGAPGTCARIAAAPVSVKPFFRGEAPSKEGGKCGAKCNGPADCDPSGYDYCNTCYKNTTNATSATSGICCCDVRKWQPKCPDNAPSCPTKED